LKSSPAACSVARRSLATAPTPTNPTLPPLRCASKPGSRVGTGVGDESAGTWSGSRFRLWCGCGVCSSVLGASESESVRTMNFGDLLLKVVAASRHTGVVLALAYLEFEGDRWASSFVGATQFRRSHALRWSRCVDRQTSAALDTPSPSQESPALSDEEAELLTRRAKPPAPVVLRPAGIYRQALVGCGDKAGASAETLG